MNETAGQRIESLGLSAVDVLKAALTKSDYTKGDVIRIKAAQTALGSWTRFRATESAERGNLLMLARELSKDKDEFRELVKIGMPTAPMLKALPKNTTRAS